MVNFYPSPIECLIFRANQKISEVKEIPKKKENEEENEEKNESSRKILNDLANNSNIINSPKKDLLNHNNDHQIYQINLSCNIENNQFSNKMEIELQNLEKK
jgi:hypothetical protein